MGAGYAVNTSWEGPVVWDRKAALADAIRAGDAVMVSRLLKALGHSGVVQTVMDEALTCRTMTDPTVLRRVAEQAPVALKNAVLRQNRSWSCSVDESVAEELFSHASFVDEFVEFVPHSQCRQVGALLRSRGFRAALERLVLANDGYRLMKLREFAQDVAKARCPDRDGCCHFAQSVFTQEMLTELARCAVTHDRFDALAQLRYGMPGFVSAVLPLAVRLESSRAVVILLGGSYVGDISNVRYRDAGPLVDMVKRELAARPGDEATYRAARALTQHGDNLPWGFNSKWWWKATGSAAEAMAFAYRVEPHEALLTRVRGLLEAAYRVPHSDVCKPLDTSVAWDRFMDAGAQAWGSAPLGFALQWAVCSRMPERLKWVLAAMGGKKMDTGLLAEAVVRQVWEVCRVGTCTPMDIEGVVALVNTVIAGKEWHQLATVALVAATVCMGESSRSPQEAVRFIVDLATALRAPLDIGDNAVLAALAMTAGGGIRRGAALTDPTWWDKVAQGILEAMP